MAETRYIVLLTDTSSGRAGARVCVDLWRATELVNQGLARWDRPTDGVQNTRRKARARTKG
ncbi:MAG: hypothetical protein DWQ20_00680 [Actinobacteria bacterium]|nr:MAG: hypothetical protein DWQ20_00680 [Actinomycetota bacterium]